MRSYPLHLLSNFFSSLILYARSRKRLLLKNSSPGRDGFISSDNQYTFYMDEGVLINLFPNRHITSTEAINIVTHNALTLLPSVRFVIWKIPDEEQRRKENLPCRLAPKYRMKPTCTYWQTSATYDCNHSTNKCTIILYYTYIYIA
jgi:hypothetical protein